MIVSRVAHLDVHMRRFGEAVTRAREARGMSRGDLCAACGLPDGTLERVERGLPPFRGFGLTEICRLASALSTSPEGLLEAYEKAISPKDAWWRRGGCPPEEKET
jgi:transcriptional regulator with XRE-family HTH domain